MVIRCHTYIDFSHKIAPLLLFINEKYDNNNTTTVKGIYMLINTRRKEICDKVWTELTHEFENAKAANSQL